jgi:hypothetical protein
VARPDVQERMRPANLQADGARQEQADAPLGARPPVLMGPDVEARRRRIVGAIDVFLRRQAAKGSK